MLMARLTELDKQWQELMALCDTEAKYERENHPKLLKLVARRIDDLAASMGFGRRQIQTREFRALRKDEHIVKIITEP